MFHDISAYADAAEGVLKSQICFLEGDTVDLFTGSGLPRQVRTAKSTRGPREEETDLQTKRKKLKASIAKLNELHCKLHADLFYSKDEIAWGKLSASDLNEIASPLRNLLLPLSGMSILPEILETGVKNEGPRDDSSDKHDNLKNPAEGASKHAMQKVVETHHARLMDAARLVNLGLAHFL